MLAKSDTGGIGPLYQISRKHPSIPCFPAKSLSSHLLSLKNVPRNPKGLRLCIKFMKSLFADFCRRYISPL